MILNLAHRFRRIFPVRHTVLPVIHVESEEQALRNASIARDAGSDGVFLINHEFGYERLLAIHSIVAETHRDWWIGVNCLGISAENVFGAISPNVAGVWVDNAGIDESRVEQPAAQGVLATRDSHAPDCLYFGGVAFKYQRSVDDLESAARMATRYVDVVTTSGPGTGESADLSKIQRMKSALGETPLAIASGITPENVGDYLPYVDCYLVATGISKSFTELDPQRVRLLVQRIRSGE